MEKSCRTSPSVYRCTAVPPTPSAGSRSVTHGKVKGVVNSLKSTASGLPPAKREANSSLREATTLTQVSGSTSWVEELVSVGKIPRTKKGGDLLLQVAHTGQQCSLTQPANFAKVFKKQIAVLHVDLVNQCLELAVFQAAGEDGVDDLHHNRYDLKEVGRLGGAHSPLLNDAVHPVYGLGVSGGLTVAHQQRSGALLSNHRCVTVGRHANKT